MLLTMAGLEVEELEAGRAAVQQCRGRRRCWKWSSIPNADRLNVCQVDAGEAAAAAHRLRRAQCRSRHESAVRAGRRSAARQLRHQAGQGARRRVVRHAVLGERAGAGGRKPSGLWLLPTDAPVGQDAPRISRSGRQVVHPEADAESQRLPVGCSAWRAKSRH